MKKTTVLERLKQFGETLNEAERGSLEAMIVKAVDDDVLSQLRGGRSPAWMEEGPMWLRRIAYMRLAD